MTEYAKPIPEVTELMRPFWEAARRHRLVVQRCRGCGAHRFPAREICSTCLSRDSEWVAASGKGTVFSYAVMHQAYHPGFAREVPYAIVIVKLAEGPKMISSLINCAAHSIRIGSAVEVCFEEVSCEVTLPRFKLAAGAGCLS